MILDERTEFADATAVGVPNNTTVNVGDVINLESIGVHLGSGEPVYLVITIQTAITSGGASVVSLLLSSDSTGTLAVDGTQTTHWESDRLAVAGFTAGKRFVVPLPQSDAVGHTYEQFLGVQVRESGSVVLTGGTINAFLTLDPVIWKAFADAVN